MRDKFWKGKKIIITGANGFLASHVTVRLLESSARVLGIIKEKIPASFLNSKLKENKHSNLSLIKNDIVDYRFIKGIFIKYRPDICFHLAAQAIVGQANKSPIPTFKTNIEGTWNILDAVREFSPKTVVVVASSDKAYGEHKQLPYAEGAALQALHPYDASKACADILTRVYAHTYNLAAAVTRCGNIYGPGDLNFSRIIPDTIRSIVSNNDPVIRSDGTPLRDYVYIDDVVDAYLCLAKALYLRQKDIRGQAFNFGTGKPVSVLKLVNLLIDISGNKRLKPDILLKAKIKGEIDKQYLSSLKARKVLGWKPRYSLIEGLKKTFEWYKDYSKGEK
ncbi:MAG: GDP-mannose 4,6-dehydratase [Candidatus Omnitrophota bacterium]